VCTSETSLKFYRTLRCRFPEVRRLIFIVTAIWISDYFHKLIGVRSNPFKVIIHVQYSFHSLTHSWSWALLEKPVIVQPLKNFPAFYGIRRFITVFTRALHWSLSWVTSMQSILSRPISLRSILILSTHLRIGIPSCLFPSGYPTNILYAILFACLTLLDLSILLYLANSTSYEAPHCAFDFIQKTKLIFVPTLSHWQFCQGFSPTAFKYQVNPISARNPQGQCVHQAYTLMLFIRLQLITNSRVAKRVWLASLTFNGIRWLDSQLHVVSFNFDPCVECYNQQELLLPHTQPDIYTTYT
jgi:hypothetical protein